MSWGPEDWEPWVEPVGDEAAGAPAAGETALELVLRLPDRLSKTVAEVGCGVGQRLPFLAAHFGRVIALESHAERLCCARRHARGLGVEFLRSDFIELSSLHGQLDVALAVESAFEREGVDVDAVLAELYRCLVEGGVLLATFRATPRAGRPYPLRLSCDAAPGHPGPIHEIELQYRLRRLGFQGLRIRRLPCTPGPGESLLCTAVRRAHN